MIDPNSLKTDSSSSGANSALIGGLVAALVVLIVASLLIAAYCVRRRRRGILSGLGRTGISEIPNPAYVGDTKLYPDPANLSTAQNSHEHLPPYLEATSPPQVVLDGRKLSSRLGDDNSGRSG